MSKIGNHRVERQETYGYYLGWIAAEEGRSQLPQSDKYRDDFRLGWQDYHDQENHP